MPRQDLNAENIEKLKDLTKDPELKNFVDRHCRKRQYGFQVLSKVICTFQTLKDWEFFIKSVINMSYL